MSKQTTSVITSACANVPGEGNVRMTPAGKGRLVGWKLDSRERLELLSAIPPTWPDVVADHVTLSSLRKLPIPGRVSGLLVGIVDDGMGLQAVVASIDGTTIRPDGHTFHVTWSLDRARGRRAVESNRVLAGLGWSPFPVPIAIALEPGEM